MRRGGYDQAARTARVSAACAAAGQEHVPWSLTALVLVIARLCEPSSELRIAEHFYRQSALCDLLGVPLDKVDDNRLYRGLDELLPHKRALEVFLKERFGELFAIEYDLLLYDVTSTYFEGQANANPLAKCSYSRDHRPDCKQVCIGLVVTRCGLPLGYEVFAGNRHDSTTLKEIVETMEARYGRAQRIWAIDRGLVSEENLASFKAGQRQYIVGTPKSQLQRFEQQLATQDWHAIRDGLEVKLCPCEDRVLAHILVCFLAYVLWKFLGQLCQQAGLGNEPRRVLDELSELRAVDVVLPTQDGREIRTRCVTQPDDHQKILIKRLRMALPGRLQKTDL